MKVYIASLSDYNNGRLEGKWFDLSDYLSASDLMDDINDMLNDLTEKYNDGEVREEWAVHDYEDIPPTLASEYMGEADFEKLLEIRKVAEDRNIPVEVLVERAGDTGSDDYEALAESLVMVVDGSDELDIVHELEDQMGELGNDFWKDYIFIDDVTERVMYGEDVDRYREDILYENPDMDEEEAERQAEEMADEEADRRRDLSTYLEDMGYGDEIPDFVTKDYNDAWKYALSYDYDVIHHDGEMYVFTNNYSLGGTILSGLVGAYIGYKIGRAKPQKKGFSTEKKIGRKIKGAFSKKKYAEGGGVAEYWKPIDESSIYRGVHDYSLDYIDDDETPLEGEVWIKFKSIPKGITNLPYEVKRAIESDFEYYGYSNSKYPKSVNLNEGSWFDYYISFRNLTYKELEDLLVKLPEQVAESLEEQEIKGYGELGFYTYGNYIDAEISSDYEEDQDEYAKGGGVSKFPVAIERRINEINELLPKVKESDEIAGGYFGSTHYTYVQLTKPIEIKGKYVYIHSANGKYDMTFEKRYNVNKLDDEIDGRKSLNYDLSNILKAFKSVLKGKYARGGKAKGVEWMKSNGQYEAYLGELYLIISRATERGLYQVRVTKGYRGETIGESTSEISGLDNAKDLAYDIAGDYYKQYARGGNVNTGRSWHLDRVRHNKRESYEKPLTNRKHKYDDGGQIGQEIVFDDNGEENTGVIKDITNLGDYVVKADDGRTLLAQRDLDVISLGAMRSASTEAPRKRFGFFEDGGSVSGNQNKRFLDSLDVSYKQRVLRNIANHYGISIVEAEEEVTDSESENLYEYITDSTLRMQVYNDMKNRRYDNGGGVDEVITINIQGYPYYLKKMGDTTHFKLANSKEGIDYVIGSHIGQHKGEEYYSDVASWLKGGKSPNGKSYNSFYYAQGGGVSGIDDLIRG